MLLEIWWSHKPARSFRHKAGCSLSIAAIKHAKHYFVLHIMWLCKSPIIILTSVNCWMCIRRSIVWQIKQNVHNVKLRFSPKTNISHSVCSFAAVSACCSCSSRNGKYARNKQRGQYPLSHLHFIKIPHFMIQKTYFNKMWGQHINKLRGNIFSF